MDLLVQLRRSIVDDKIIFGVYVLGMRLQGVKKLRKSKSLPCIVGTQIYYCASEDFWVFSIEDELGETVLEIGQIESSLLTRVENLVILQIGCT